MSGRYVNINGTQYSLDSPGSIELAYEALDTAVRISKAGQTYLASHPVPGDLRKRADTPADALSKMKRSLVPYLGDDHPLAVMVKLTAAKLAKAQRTLTAAAERIEKQNQEMEKLLAHVAKQREIEARLGRLEAQVK